MIVEKHRRSRKLAFLMLALIFFNSVLTLKLRSYQRQQNLNLLRNRLKSNREIFDSIERKSRTEDMLLLIGTNMAALIIIAGFDRQRVIDENKDKERAVKVFGR